MFFCILLNTVFEKFIHVVEYTIVAVHSFLLPIVFSCMNMPQLIYPFYFWVISSLGLI